MTTVSTVTPPRVHFFGFTSTMRQTPTDRNLRTKQTYRSGGSLVASDDAGNEAIAALFTALSQPDAVTSVQTVRSQLRQAFCNMLLFPTRSHVVLLLTAPTAAIHADHLHELVSNPVSAGWLIVHLRLPDGLLLLALPYRVPRLSAEIVQAVGAAMQMAVGPGAHDDLHPLHRITLHLQRNAMTRRQDFFL